MSGEKYTPTREELTAQWNYEHGDHTECPDCGSQCRDSFMGDDLTPAQKHAEALVEALDLCQNRLYARAEEGSDKWRLAVDKACAALALARGEK